MKAVILVALLATVGLAMAAPQLAEVLRSEQEVVAPERYRYDYALSDQSAAKQSGSIVNPQEPDQEKRELQVEGEYSYISKEGDKVRVAYTANAASGYQAQVYINDVLQNPPQ